MDFNQGHECDSVALAVNINQESGEVRILFQMFDGATPIAFTMMPLEIAHQILTGLWGRNIQAGAIQEEIMSTPPDDREATLRRICERSASDTN